MFYCNLYIDRMALISEQTLQRSGNSPHEHRKIYINHYYEIYYFNYLCTLLALQYLYLEII